MVQNNIRYHTVSDGSDEKQNKKEAKNNEEIT
jgi:hypothetical protein